MLIFCSDINLVYALYIHINVYIHVYVCVRVRVCVCVYLKIDYTLVFLSDLSTLHTLYTNTSSILSLYCSGYSILLHRLVKLCRGFKSQ